MKRESLALLLLMLCLCWYPARTNAQTLTVSGTVTAAADNTPLPGVTVTVEGTQIATATDENGNYSIDVPNPGVSLIFQQLGMATQTIRVNDSGPLHVALVEDRSTLNEVVVIGYGTQRKSVVTGAISSVKASDIENQVVGRLETALQGRSSGVTVTRNSGAPCSSASIRIGGVSTLNNNTPLYVVDGVEADEPGAPELLVTVTPELRPC